MTAHHLGTLLRHLRPETFSGLFLLPLRIGFRGRSLRLFRRRPGQGGSRKKITRRDHRLYLESILESSTNTAIVATDQDLRIWLFNGEAERLLGLPRQEALDRSLVDIHDRFASRRVRDFRQVMDELRNRGRCHFEMWRNGHFLDVQISSLRDSDQDFAGLLLMGRDVTSLKRAEEEKKRSLLRLQRAEKMEAIGLLAGGVAHDLNNILSGVINYPELLLATLPPDSEYRQPLQSILAAGQRAAAVVNDLLTMSRDVAMAWQSVSLNDLVRDYLQSLEGRQLASRHPGVRIRFHPAPSLCPCRCSPIHITKMIMNLVTNAVEAAGEQGEVHISTACGAAADNTARGNGHAGGDVVVLEVRDTGPGIPAEHRDKIFEPFYSTKVLGRSGSGLGLAVVWNAVHSHDGNIEVGSDSRGTVFTVRLPAGKEADDTRQDATGNRVESPLPRGTGSVLVVDDDAMQREISHQMLTHLGYSAHTVSSGEEALTYLQHHRVEVVLLDMVLGGMSGYETFRQIIGLHPEQYVLLASGYSESDDLEKALAAGAAGFLKKPYSLRELSLALRRRQREPHVAPRSPGGNDEHFAPR